MKNCHKHLLFHEECIECLVDRIEGLERNLERLEEISEKANDAIRQENRQELAECRDQMDRLRERSKAAEMLTL